MTWRVAIAVALLCGWRALAAADDLRFDRDVRPILSNHCFECHGPDENTREAGLRLDTQAGLFAETDYGSLPVVPGDAEASELLRRVLTEDESERMPPAEHGKPLGDEQIALLQRWIAAGAPWQQHWAYVPPVRPEVPTPDNSAPESSDPEDNSLSDHPVDRFLLARQQQAGLSPSPTADPVTLARRVALDLTGLAPDADEVAAFAADPSPAAYEALVDRLLDSPHFGERMAVYWLDLVRYADSCGYHSDVDQRIWPYRDYVIRAFNTNLPFDQFTREQLAGDLLPEPTLDQRVATGYNRLNKTTEEGGAQEGEYLAKSSADRVRTTASVWMAATLGCAECHDHKYDPFTTRDFYSFAAIFADMQERGVYGAGKREPEMAVPSLQQAAELERLQAALDALNDNAPQDNASDVADKTASESAEDSSAEDSADESADDAQQTEKRREELQQKLAALQKALPRSMVTVSVEPRTMRVLPRGDWLDDSGEVVEGALPAFLADGHASSGRATRLDLADWLVAQDNPLTARVFVNRLWRMFYGVGLSRYLDDLGAQGESPTHPELLDWLAVEFMEHGWDVKRTIKLLVTSQAYQQSSIPTAEHLQLDPQNRLFARQARWRLEAEFIRDAALAASGLLVTDIGGPSVKPYQPEGYWDFLNFPLRKYRADAGDKQYRRGLYTHWQRTFLHPSLLAFDASTREECTAERPTSNTPKAALALLNDPTYVEAARALAALALQQGGSTDQDRIEWTWRRTTSRLPDEREQQLLAELLADARAAYHANDEAALATLSVGLTPWPRELPPTELAAWTTVARAALNVSEAIMRN